NRANTRANGSWEGLPWGRGRTRCHHAAWAQPYAARSTPVSAPHMTAHTAITTLSTMRGLVVRSPRGSGSRATGARRRPRLDVAIAVLPTHRAVVQDSPVNH